MARLINKPKSTKRARLSKAKAKATPKSKKSI